MLGNLATCGPSPGTQFNGEGSEGSNMMPVNKTRGMFLLRDSTYLWSLCIASNFSFAALITREVQTYPLGRVLGLVPVAVRRGDGLLARRIIGHVHIGSGSGPGSESKMGRIPSDARRRWCHVLLNLG